MFVARAKEKKDRDVQEAIYALMKPHGAEMRDSAKAVAKEMRSGFAKAAKAAVEEDVSKVRDDLDLCSRMNVEEAASVADDDYIRRRDQTEEVTSYSM